MSAAPRAWLAGLQQRCPQCGRGQVFAGYLKLRDRCASCGADFSGADAGDGPAVFVILIVGAVAAPLLLVLQFGLKLDAATALAITMAASLLLCLALLPLLKSMLFALQWAHKAREATNDDVAGS